MALASPEVYAKAALAALQPDPRETVSEWADKFMRLPSESSESSEPGRWLSGLAPVSWTGWKGVNYELH